MRCLLSLGVYADPTAVRPAQTLRPLFVLSVVRSGSTLLYTLLNQHSQIALLCEGDLPSLQLYLWGRFHSGGWRQRWEFWNQGSSRHGIDIESMPASVPDVWEATRAVYQAVARRKQATFWGDKTHWSEGSLRLAEKFPDARFIFLWRDLHGVMEGIAKGALTERYYRKAGIANRALLGNERLRQACGAMKSRGRRVHEVHYEDLVAHPSECMQGICQFLEIPFEARMTSLKGADRSAIAGGGHQHHDGLWCDTITAEKQEGDLIPPVLRRKIDRYICRWRRRYEDQWPKPPSEHAAGGVPPGLFELWRDRITYRSLILWDEMVKVIYALAPLTAGRSFRRWLHQPILREDYSLRRNESFSQTPVFERTRGAIGIQNLNSASGTISELVP